MIPRLIGSAAAFSAARPRRVLLVALAIVALSALALSRASVDPTLTGMLGGGNPAAAALARVADRFHAAEDLLVVALAPDDQAPAEAQRDLLAFADRFAHLIAQSPEARAAATAIHWRPDPALADFLRDAALPAGTLYLDDAGFAALLDRLQPDSVRDQLAQTEAMLAAPGPAALARRLAQDPLRLRDFIQAHARAGPRRATGPLEPDDAADFSTDGRALLVRVSGARPVSDMEFSRAFTALVTRLADDAARDTAPGLTVRIGGGYAIAALASTAIRADAIASSISAVVLIQLFFLLAFRRLLTPFILIAAAGIGIVAAFGVHALAISTITPLTAVLAAMLAGLGVDYAIHFLVHHQSAVAAGLATDDASRRTAHDLAGPLLAACLTTIFGFGAIALGELQMLRDFAILGCLGLAASLASVLFVLPAMLALLGARRLTGTPTLMSPVRRAIGWADTRRGPALAAGAALIAAAALALALTPGFLPAFDSDTTVLHPRPNPALDTGALVRDRFRDAGDHLLVHIAADSPAQLLERAHDAARALDSPAARAAGVTGALGLASLLPDPRAVPARLRRLDAVDHHAVLAGIRREFDASALDPAAFADYLAFLERLLTNRRAPTLDDLLAAPALARQLLPADAPGRAQPTSETIILVTASSAASARSSRSAVIAELRALLAPVPGATLTGLTIIAADFEHAARRDLARFGLLAAGLVVLWLLVTLRRPADVALALTPVVFATLCVLGAMSALGARFNTVNIIAIPLLAGIAVDSGIFLVSTARRARAAGRDPRPALAATTHAILCTAATTCLGFGTLISSGTPAVRSLGMAALLGVLASLAGCLLVLLPLLLRRAPRPAKDHA